MSDKLTIIKQTFDDIADAIREKGVYVDPCDSPTTYDDRIREISTGGGSGSDISDVDLYVYNSENAEGTIFLSDSVMTFRLGLPRGLDGKDGQDGQDGQDGADGMDGSMYEYVYFRGLTEEDKPPTPISGVGNNQDDFVPTYQKPISIGESAYTLKWHDRAQGVDSVFQYEWQSSRKKEGNAWSDFTEPILWAKYGEKGKDGDGIQYIFTVTDVFEVPKNPTPAGDITTNSGYQTPETKEWIPEGWSDDPIEVTEKIPYCWMSMRRFRDGLWGPCTNPILWDEYLHSNSDDDIITADVIVIDMDPNSAMVNEGEEGDLQTTIRAYRGDDPISILSITGECRNPEDSVEITPIEQENHSWIVKFSNLKSESSVVYVKLEIKLSETSTRYKTFQIYQTKYDQETVSLDIDDDNLLIPCSDGTTPDTGYFPRRLPVFMRVGGIEQTIDNITAENFTDFEFRDGYIILNSVPEDVNSIKFTAISGEYSATASVSYTKFDTKGGTISMYSLNIKANDIVCDTRSGKNEYKVYTGKLGSSDNKINVGVFRYSSDGNVEIQHDNLPEDYRIFYANDPQDWVEDAESSLNEYKYLDKGYVVIGGEGDDHINPDECVSFQLRQWIGDPEKKWSDNNEKNYKVWDTESIIVDIIRTISEYRFIFDPTVIHRNVEGHLTSPEDGKLKVSMVRNIAGDGEIVLEPVTELPTGYDLYYKIDSGDFIKIGGEGEYVSFEKLDIDISNVKNQVTFYMVIDESSPEDNLVVLTETLEVTSDIPGKSAYVGYLTDSMGVVTCDANGTPVAGLELGTEFKVTNGIVQSVKIWKENSTDEENSELLTDIEKQLTFESNGGQVIFKDFSQKNSLKETLKIPLEATYIDMDGNTGHEYTEYTIIKLAISESNTMLDFGNDSLTVPCDKNGELLTNEVSTIVGMSYGSTELNITSNSPYYKDGKIVIPLTGESAPTFTSDVAYIQMTFTGTGTLTDGTNITKEKTGQIQLIKVRAGESGRVFDLQTSAAILKYDNDSDSFLQDCVEAWVIEWSADGEKRLTLDEMKNKGLVIKYKPNDGGDEKQISLEGTDDHFKIYVNSQQENGYYCDVDNGKGMTISLYAGDELLQQEVISASYDPRDFGKFELLLSDSTINQIYKKTKDNQIYREQVSISPDKVGILGVYENEGLKRIKYDGQLKLHEKYVSGLDVYYSIDKYLTEFDANQMIEVKDTNNDGWVSNDTIDVNLNEIKDCLYVYLIAHYNPVDDQESSETIPTIVDCKSLPVNPIEIPVTYHLELTQDEVMIPIDSEGNVDDGFSVNITPLLYAENDLQEETFEYCFGSDTIPESGWVIYTNSEFTSESFGNNSFIWFKWEDLYKRCKITRIENPIELFVDKNVVTRGADGKIEDTITVTVKTWNYTNNEWDIVDNANVNMVYTTVYGSSSSEISAVNNKFVLNEYEDISAITITATYGKKTTTEKIGVITDGIDGSSREVIYYATSEQKEPKNPTPNGYESNDKYQIDDTTPSYWFKNTDSTYAESYHNISGNLIKKDEYQVWTDEYPGISDTNKYIYISERKRLRGAHTAWGKFSDPRLYTQMTYDGQATWSISISEPVVVVNDSRTPINPKLTFTVSAYLSNVRKEIKAITVKIGDSIVESSSDGDYDFTIKLPNTIAEEKLEVDVVLTLEEDHIYIGKITCPVLTQESPVSPIAVYLDNEHGKMSWYANGEADVNTLSCNITAKRGYDPKTIVVDSNDSTFNVTVSGNYTEQVTVILTSDKKLSPGQYECPISILIDGETLSRIIIVTVDEIPNGRLDVVMDRTAHIPYVTEEVLSYNAWKEEAWMNWIPVVGSIMYLTMGFVHGKNYETVYTPKSIDLTGIKVFANGVQTKNWSISDITIGKQSIGSPDQEGRNEWYHVNVTDGFIVLNLYKLLTEYIPNNNSGELVVYITFNVEGFDPYVAEVLLNADKKATRYDFDLSTYSMKQGTSQRVYLYLGYVSEGGVTVTNSPLSTTSPKVTLSMRPISKEDGIDVNWQVDSNGQTYIDIEDIQEDTVLAIWVYDNDGNKVGHCRQVISCLGTSVDYYALETGTPFIQVDEFALTSEGHLVGNPINFKIIHHNGNEKIILDKIPDNHYIKTICEGWVNETISYDEWSDEAWSIFINTEYLYKSTDPIKIELRKTEDDSLVDTITIEKTVIYPDPMIYPAGEWDTSKGYSVDFNRVPYVSYNDGNSIKYYVGNRDILKKFKTTSWSINGGSTPENAPQYGYNTGYDNVNYENGWVEMESFEAVYADIGVFKQALVGPLVFYKDDVFSQTGTAIKLIRDNAGNRYSPGTQVTVNAVFENINRLIASGSSKSFDTLWKDFGFTPNFKLNAKTGQLSLTSTKDNASTITIGDSITIGGTDSCIQVGDLHNTGSDTTMAIGTLTLGKDNNQVLQYNGDGIYDDHYFGVGIGNTPSCEQFNGGGFVIASNNKTVKWTNDKCYSHNSTPTLNLNNKEDGIALNILSGQVAGLRPYFGNQEDLVKIGTIPSCFLPSVYQVEEQTSIILPDPTANKFVLKGDTFEIWLVGNDDSHLNIRAGSYETPCLQIVSDGSVKKDYIFSVENGHVIKIINTGTKWLIKSI